MREGKVFVKIMHRQCSGIGRRQNKVMPMHKIIWV